MHHVNMTLTAVDAKATSQTGRHRVLLGLLFVGVETCGQVRANDRDPDSPDRSGEAVEHMCHLGCYSTASSLTETCASDH